ncbi:MAG: GyrI-like domain-containing protein [Clostridiales bacterium]|nr:GyrI-like domain-containing protein [Clostridiales bacterium]
MNVKKCIKPSFTVIGKEGSTNDGSGFIQRLWQEANSHFDEIAHLAKRDEAGNLCGIWGAMSNFSRSFKPWESNFSRGLYLAGAECIDGADAPKGWTKWIIPGYEYLYVESEGMETFSQMITYLADNNIELVGAAYDFTEPKTQQGYMYFPIRKL